MPLATRRAREKQQRYENIVTAAEEVFFDKGYAQASMDEIAGKAQLSRALLYVYFKDKAAIMRAVMLKAAQALEARFQQAMNTGRSGMEQIKGIGRAYYAFSVEESDYFDVMTEMNTFPMPAEPDAVTAAMSACRSHCTDMMVAALAKGIKDGSLNPGHVHDPLLTAYILQGALHGVIMSTRQPKDPQQHYPDSEKLVLESIEMMCYAMRASESSASHGPSIQGAPRDH